MEPLSLFQVDKRFLFASGRARAPARTRIRREEGSLLTASVHRSYREETPVVVGAGGWRPYLLAAGIWREHIGRTYYADRLRACG